MGVVQVPASGRAPHTLGVPEPPQLSPAGQVPQSSWPPQPSPTVPQYFPPVCWQVMGVQVPGVALQTFATLAPQVCPAGQVPQFIWPPQPLPTVPQYLPFAGVQLKGLQVPPSGV